MESRRMVDRHRNPLGIFLRIPLYLFLFWALWFHQKHMIGLVLLIDLLLWFFIPPVAPRSRFVDEIIAIEIAWFQSNFSWMKLLSFLILLTGLVAIGLGLWVHTMLLIGMGFLNLIVFNILMRAIARSAF